MIRALLAFLCLSLPAAAQEFVELGRTVDDETFYRAVACGAAPGRDCSKNFLRWPEDRRKPLSVGFAKVTPALFDYQARLYDQGLQDAIDQINGLGADIFLQLDPNPKDVSIHVVDTPPGGVLSGTGEPLLDGTKLPLGLVALRATRDGEIKAATIAISSATRRRAIASVILEELVQSLGLMTDIRSPSADYRWSIFSEDSNSGTRLRGQDATAVLLHYPRN